MKTNTILLFILLFSFQNIYSQSTIWSENFIDQENKGAIGPGNTINTTGITKWTIDVSSADLSQTTDWFMVKDGVFETRDSDGECIWTSESISISDYSNVSINISLSEEGTLESGDFIKTYYKLNNGNEILINENSDDFTSTTHTKTGLSGSEIQIIIKTTNNGADEYIRFDDITVTGTLMGNAKPEITSIINTPSQVYSNLTTDISANIIDSDGSISSAILKWGLSSGSLINTISLNNSSGSIYTTATSIPSQNHSNTIYFTITATDNEDGVTTSTESTVFVYPLIILSELCDPTYDYAKNKYIEITNLESTSVNLTNYKVIAIGNGVQKFQWELTGTIDSKESKTCGDTENTSFTPDFADNDWSTSNSTWNGASTDGALIKFNDNITDDISDHGNFSNQSSIRLLSCEKPNTSYNSAEWFTAEVDAALDASPGYHICVWNGNTNTSYNTTTNWQSNKIPDIFSHAIIPISSNNPVCSNNISICDFTLNTDASFSLDATNQFTIGNLIVESAKNNKSAGNFIINSDENGNASLIINGSSTGSVVVKRYIPGYTNSDDGWHIISSPIENMIISNSDFDTEININNDLYQFNEITNIWENYKQLQFSNFENGKGYMTAFENNITASFQGELITSNIDFNNLSYTEVQGGGWHILGNPFPSAIQWNTSDWNLSNIGGVAKIWNESSGNYSDIEEDDFIPSTNAFYIQNSASTNSITIPLSARTHQNIANYKSNNEILNKLQIIVSSDLNEFQDKTTIGIRDTATFTFDLAFDSHKLFGNTEAPQIYSQLNSDMYSINYIPHPNEDYDIPINFKAGVNGEYILNIIGSSLFQNADLILEDLFLNKNVDLNQEQITYKFQSDLEDSENRFLLHIIKSNYVEDLNEQDLSTIYILDKNIIIENLDRYTIVVISDVLGRIIYEASINENRNIISIDKPTGIYFVTLINHYKRNTKKIIFR